MGAAHGVSNHGVSNLEASPAWAASLPTMTAPQSLVCSAQVQIALKSRSFLRSSLVSQTLSYYTERKLPCVFPAETLRCLTTGVRNFWAVGCGSCQNWD